MSRYFCKEISKESEKKKERKSWSMSPNKSISEKKKKKKEFCLANDSSQNNPNHLWTELKQ